MNSNPSFPCFRYGCPWRRITPWNTFRDPAVVNPLQPGACFPGSGTPMVWVLSLLTRCRMAKKQCSVLGNSVKPCHPQKVGFLKFMERVREAALWGRFAFVRRGGVKSSDEFLVFCEFLNWHRTNSRTRPLYSNSRSVSGYAIFAGIRRQEIAEAWSQEVAGTRGSRTGEASESQTCEPMCSDLRNSGVTDERFENY
jgi:hypothetical protein